MDNSRKKIVTWIVMALIALCVFVLTQFTFTGVMIQIIVCESFPGGPLFFISAGWITCAVVAVYSFKKHKRKTLSIVTTLLMTILTFNMLLWAWRDNARMARMASLQQEIDRHIKKEDKLPLNMKENEYYKILSPGPFGIDNIMYLRQGQNYKLSSYGVPIGPFDVYDSKTKEWTAEE